jgi:hypothetical protein
VVNVEETSEPLPPDRLGWREVSTFWPRLSSGGAVGVVSTEHAPDHHRDGTSTMAKHHNTLKPALIVGGFMLAAAAFAAGTAKAQMPYGSGTAVQDQNRFVEIHLTDTTDTFDLSTVKEIQPGRFVVAEISMEIPDLMKFELNALRKLEKYCSFAIGSYAVPEDLLIAGVPDDLPVSKIEVTSPYNSKGVEWKYPYKKFAWSASGPRSMVYRCSSKTEFMDHYTLITDGLHTRRIFDCRNALDGWLDEKADDPAKAMMLEVRQDTISAREYIRLCTAVYHEKPREPGPRPDH